MYSSAASGREYAVGPYRRGCHHSLVDIDVSTFLVGQGAGMDSRHALSRHSLANDFVAGNEPVVSSSVAAAKAEIVCALLISR